MGDLKMPGCFELTVGGLCLVIVVAVLAPVWLHPPTHPQRSAALSNVKQCTTALIMYTSDYDDVFPYVSSQAKLESVLFEYTKNRHIWETLNLAKPGDYTYNRSLPGSKLTEVLKPMETPMFLDPFARRYADDAPWLYMVGFVDGHAKAVTAANWEKSRPLLSIHLPKYGKPLL